MGLSCEIDSNFFSIFNYKILEGDLQDFQSGGAVLVSRRFASMIDDGNGVVGRTIGRTVGEDDGVPAYKDYVIGGIVEDLDNTLVMYYDIFFSAAKSSYATYGTPFQSYGSHLSVIKRKKEVDEQTRPSRTTSLTNVTRTIRSSRRRTTISNSTTTARCISTRLLICSGVQTRHCWPCLQ